VTLDEINAMDAGAFAACFGWVFEHSPWVAERAWAHRPFEDVGDLHSAMVVEVQRATRQEQLTLIRAHPDLGAREPLTAPSAREQSGAGLDVLDAGEAARLRELNAAYREKFGFPFILAVRGVSKKDILKALERRVSSTAEAEFRHALDEIYRIALFRLGGGRRHA
jgi:2-oxo-4-hydroxy-4-carboxy-5-ureidoimidazoline decarboxylase